MAAVCIAMISFQGEAGARRTPVLPVRVDPGSQGRSVPASFVGLSIEHPDLPDYTGSAQSPNLAFVRLLQLLESFGGGAPTIRIGGRSSDQSWWNPGRVARPPGVLDDLGPEWAGGLAAVAGQAHTPVVLGLNLGLGDPANARQVAQSVLGALPPGAVQSLELGNEPDLFTKPRIFHVGGRVLHRERHRKTYDFNNYIRDLDTYSASLSGLGTTFSAGGFAGREWSSKTGELLGRTKGRIHEFGVHSYPLQTCGHARKRPASKLIFRLLQSRGSIKRIGRLNKVARRHGAVLRVSETNSAVCGGVGRVSNTFATALWGTDTLFRLLKVGAIGVNFHTFTGAWYAPVEFRTLRGQRVALVKPLFYGMLLFEKATANNSRLVRAHWSGHKRVRVWATKDAKGTVRVVLLNVNRHIDRRARIRVPGGGGGASIERLNAPSLGARTGVRLSGRTFGRRSLTGRMKGRLVKTRLRRSHGVYEFHLPAASGALLTIRP